MDKQMTWDEIEQAYPDRWVGLSKVEWEDDANVRSAVVLGGSETGDEFLGRQLNGEDVYTVYTTTNNLCPLGILAGGR